jgi:hypothetical protein
MNGTNSSATQKLCLISHLARFWADNGLSGSYPGNVFSTTRGPQVGLGEA